jgi:hypothetical protein
MRLIGIDPGPVVGMALLALDGGALVTREALQVTPGLILAGFLDSLAVEVVAVERFVVGPRAGRSSTPAAGAMAREIVAVVR